MSGVGSDQEPQQSSSRSRKQFPSCCGGAYVFIFPYCGSTESRVFTVFTENSG